MKTVTRHRRLTERARLEEIQTAVALCFATAEEDGKVDYRDIANRSRLSLATIYRLRDGNFTLNMRIRTLQALGYATGFRLDLTDNGVGMYLAE